MTQKIILPLYILTVSFGLSKGTNDEKPSLYNFGGCVIHGIDDADFLFGYENNAIRDDFRGVVASFPTQDVHGVNISSTKYFDVSLESNTLRIFTTDEFNNIEPEIGYAPLPRIRFELDFQCIGGDISLRFTQPLTDINNHDPYFEKENYDYTYVQSSLPSIYQLTDDQQLSAFDIDMTNNKVTFSLEENEYFSIEELSTDSTTRQTFARLTSLKTIEAPSSIKLNLHATDVREPNRFTSTVLEVNVLLKSDGEVPIPTFSNDTYTVTYKNGELFFDDEIRLTNGTGYLANITQIGYEDYFRVSFANRAEGVLKINLLQPLSNFSKTEDDNIQFEIQVLNDGTSQPAVTTVTVDFSQDQHNSSDEITSCSYRPTFSKYAYVARYVNGFVEFEDKIRINSDDYSNLIVTQNDWEDYFDLTLIKDEIKITLVKPLPRAILRNNTLVYFNVKVTKNNNESCSNVAAIWIQLPSPSNKEQFSFKRNTYVVFYNGDLALTFQEQILLVGDVNSVKMKMQNSNYTDYFYVRSPAPKLVTIELVKPLECKDFDNGIILFEIVATNIDSLNSATASVVVVWDGPTYYMVIFFDYISSYVYIFIFLAIIVAISAAIGLKLIRRKRRPTPPPPPRPQPPPYTARCEEKIMSI